MTKPKFKVIILISIVVFVLLTIAVFMLYHLYISGNSYYPGFLYYSIILGVTLGLLLQGGHLIDLQLKKRIRSLFLSFSIRLLLVAALFILVYYINNNAAALIEEKDESFLYILWICFPLIRLLSSTFTDLV
jgi:uncharacterized membrane protein